MSLFAKKARFIRKEYTFEYFLDVAKFFTVKTFFFREAKIL